MAAAVALAALPAVFAVHTDGLFELDGDQTDSALGIPHDWASLFDAAGDALPVSDPPLRAELAPDFARPDSSYHGGSDKDIEDISGWTCIRSENPQDKSDILNAYVAAYRGADGDDRIYLGVERRSNSGNTYAAFWLLQDAVSCDPGTSGSAGFQGAHVRGDLLVLSDFTGGGTVSTVRLYQWNPDVTDNLELLIDNADCTTEPPGDAACGRVNAGSIVTPWPPADSASAALGTNQFLELGLNLDALPPSAQNRCYAQMIAETRSSQELNAQLKDFVLRSLVTCDARISIAPALATRSVGAEHELTILVEADDGTGWAPASGEFVTTSILDGPGAFVGAASCTTDATGQCTVRITSSVTGTTLVIAAADIHVGAAVLHRETDGSGANSGPASTTWIGSDATIVTAPSATSIVLGASLTDTATVTGGGPTPTGQVTFRACSPAEVATNGGTCSAGGALVSVEDLVAGSATSDPFAPTAAGTWCFRGEYSGDATYPPAVESGLAECFDVERAFSTTVTVPSALTFALGGSVHDTATVTGNAAGGTPTGTVSFFVCSPAEVAENGGNCETGGSPVGAATLLDGAAVSADFIPSTAGTYCFRAEYSGDANYLASQDGSSAECFTVERAASVTVTAPSPSSLILGGSVQDTAVLAGNDAGGLPTGTVAFFVCSPAEVAANGGACTSGGTAIGSALLVDGSTASPAFVPSAAGTHCFRAEYAGDDNYLPSEDASAGECFTVERAPVVLTTLSDPTGAGVLPGTAVVDRATVAGLGSPFPVPAGTVSFYLCNRDELDDSGCSAGGSAVGTAVTLDSQGLAASDPTTGSAATGRHCFRAEYSGDANYTPAVHTNADTECFTIGQPALSLSKEVRVGTGPYADIVDAAPGETVEFRLTLRNTGTAEATGVVIRDAVPPSSTFVSCDGGCSTGGTAAGSTVQWIFGIVREAEERVVAFRVRLAPSFPAGLTEIPNTAAVDSNEEDQRLSNGVLVRVTAAPSLGILKATTFVVVTPNQTVQFTLAYYNAGNADATGATVADPLPASTTFLACSGTCSVAGGVVTWDVGTVRAGTSAGSPAGLLILLLRLTDPTGCDLCNAAQIQSPDQDDGQPIDSNVVCVPLGPDPGRARALGRGYVVSLNNVPPSFLAISRQQGAGTSAQSVAAFQSPDGLDATLDARLFHASSTATVGAGQARDASVAGVLDLNVMNGLVTARFVRAAALATATDGTAAVSAAGTVLAGVTVSGLALDTIAPNTRIDLPPDLFGAGSYVMLDERTQRTEVPTDPFAGVYRAELTVTAIRIHLVDYAAALPGAQTMDIEIATAHALAEYPRTPVCTTATPPRPGLEASARVAFAVSPPLLSVELGAVELPSEGGSASQVLDSSLAGQLGAIATVEAAESAASGVLGNATANAGAHAVVGNVCLLRLQGACTVQAQAVHAYSSSRLDATGASSDPAGTLLLNLRVAGMAVEENPEPNTVHDLPGFGFVILNEQVPLSAGSGSGLLVRGIRLVVTEPGNELGLPPGTEVIVAEARTLVRPPPA